MCNSFDGLADLNFLFDFFLIYLRHEDMRALVRFFYTIVQIQQFTFSNLLVI